MGDDGGRPDERPARVVRVDPFEIARTPVTRTQYAAYLAASGAEPPRGWADAAAADGDRPVTGVSWHDALGYTAWLRATTDAAWRLPTEAEWERAMRGGLDGARTAWGDAVPAGEIPGGPIGGPWAVGRGTPNGYGVLDPGTMVHEWCSDWYSAAYYATAPHDDPRGPDEGERRASRGGSWRHLQRWSPPAARSSLPPEFRYADYGFRPVRA
jgi:formylglycine-generating enzyme required for sulfatase activity